MSGDRGRVEMLLRWRAVQRAQASLDLLDDEIYEAAALGNAARVRYLEWCRAQAPRWLGEAEARG